MANFNSVGFRFHTLRNCVILKIIFDHLVFIERCSLMRKEMNQTEKRGLLTSVTALVTSTAILN